MAPEVRKVFFDKYLQVEAYCFQGNMQKFPNYFHDYYVFGFIEKGQRHLVCQNKAYLINAGDVILFNPRDAHTCEQVDGRTLDYHALNIPEETMRMRFGRSQAMKHSPVLRKRCLSKVSLR